MNTPPNSTAEIDSIGLSGLAPNKDRIAGVDRELQDLRKKLHAFWAETCGTSLNELQAFEGSNFKQRGIGLAEQIMIQTQPAALAPMQFFSVDREIISSIVGQPLVDIEAQTLELMADMKPLYNLTEQLCFEDGGLLPAEHVGHTLHQHYLMEAYQEANAAAIGLHRTIASLANVQQCAVPKTFRDFLNSIVSALKEAEAKKAAA